MTSRYALALVALGCLFSAPILAQEHHAAGPLSDEELIKSAESAAPMAIAKEATIIALTAEGKIRTISERYKFPRAQSRYFNENIKPLLEIGSAEFVGEVNERQKQGFLGESLALLFPIDWPEPFGLVMIEAMACGTPVIAWSRGSVPEVIENGVTGFNR